MYRDRHEIMLKQTALLEEIRDSVKNETATESM